MVALLTEAAGDGRLTLGEQAERVERAYAARTLGELAELTTDLVVPAAQPIRLDARRSVSAIFGRERREGRWVMPDTLTVSAIFGEVVLDLREAMLQSRRVTVLATMLGGTLRLIVPDGVVVETTGSAILGRKGGSVRGAAPPAPGTPVIEVRTLGLGGKVKVITPRRSRWRGGLRRRS